MTEIELNNEYVKKITDRIMTHLDKYYEEKFEFIDEDGNVTMDDDDVEICLERILEEDDMGDVIGTEDYECLLTAIWARHRKELLDKLSDIEEEIREQVEDYNLYRKLGHRAYYHHIYGLSEKDFV